MAARKAVAGAREAALASGPSAGIWGRSVWSTGAVWSSQGAFLVLAYSRAAGARKQRTGPALVSSERRNVPGGGGLFLWSFVFFFGLLFGLSSFSLVFCLVFRLFLWSFVWSFVIIEPSFLLVFWYFATTERSFSVFGASSSRQFGSVTSRIWTNVHLNVKLKRPNHQH